MGFITHVEVKCITTAKGWEEKMEAYCYVYYAIDSKISIEGKISVEGSP